MALNIGKIKMGNCIAKEPPLLSILLVRDGLAERDVSNVKNGEVIPDHTNATPSKVLAGGI